MAILYPDCGKSVDNDKKMYKHKLIHDKQEFKCEECDKTCIEIKSFYNQISSFQMLLEPELSTILYINL